MERDSKNPSRSTSVKKIFRKSVFALNKMFSHPPENSSEEVGIEEVQYYRNAPVKMVNAGEEMKQGDNPVLESIPTERPAVETDSHYYMINEINRLGSNDKKVKSFSSLYLERDVMIMGKSATNRQGSARNGNGFSKDILQTHIDGLKELSSSETQAPKPPKKKVTFSDIDIMIDDSSSVSSENDYFPPHNYMSSEENYKNSLERGKTLPNDTMHGFSMPDLKLTGKQDQKSNVIIGGQVLTLLNTNVPESSVVQVGTPTKRRHVSIQCYISGRRGSASDDNSGIEFLKLENLELKKRIADFEIILLESQNNFKKANEQFVEALRVLRR
jgi:hypothetical protein